jgi:hypothetical protein
MTAARRQDAGAAVGGLFAGSSATGGLAGRNDAPDGTRTLDSASQRPKRGTAPRQSAPSEARVRLSVELTERQSTFLRSLGRPARTGGPRTLGAKFIATGLLIAAIELVERVDIDMRNVASGDVADMASRARDALLSAVETAQGTDGDP